RLLSLAVVIMGAVWAFGIIALSGVPLSIITISGLPILIGIGVDFSIQVHSRIEEELDGGSTIGEAVGTVTTKLLPALAVAMLSAVLGFVALQVSASPAIREFGILLAVGISALFVVGILLPLALLVLRERRWPAPVRTTADGTLERASASIARSGVGVFWPLAAASVVIIVVGLALNDSTPIQTDAEEWVPSDNQQLADLATVRDATGWSSELNFMIEAQDVTEAEVVEWAHEFVTTELERHPGALARGNSLPGIAEAVTGLPPGAEEVDILIGEAHGPSEDYDVTPAAILDTFVTPNETRANLIFQIGRIELTELRELIEEMEADLDPPPGVEVSLAPPDGVETTTAGIAVIGTSVVRTFEANRSLLTWVALAAVTAWLALAY
ncbi:MAG: MMPL family transporter, partial [Actinomycetota bacterium]